MRLRGGTPEYTRLLAGFGRMSSQGLTTRRSNEFKNKLRARPRESRKLAYRG
jgi:hypothetical protein